MRYVLGLDIGSTSVGWTVGNLDKRRIEDLGARCFNAAEVPKTRESLAKPRREARSARRRVDRRRGRLDRAKAMFVRYGLLSAGKPDQLFSEHPSAPAPDPWHLRAKGLDYLLSGEEFSRALYHIAKHRGFTSNRKLDKPNDDKKKKQEAKKMLAGTEGMRRMLSECGKRTIGEMIYCHEDFRDRKRNRAGDYSHTVERAMLEEEIKRIFEAQRREGSEFAPAEFEAEFLAEAFNWQKPFASGDDIIKRVGMCTFEKDEKRAPRASWTAERFNLLCKINNLRIDGEPLTQDDRRKVERMVYTLQEVAYKQIRKKLEMAENAKFGGCPLNYRTTKKGKPVDPMDCEKSVFYSLSAYHKLQNALSPTGLWDTIKDSSDLMDYLAFVLTFYKYEDQKRAKLTEGNVASPIVEALSCDDAPSFSGEGKLSIKAMHNMIPQLEKGLKYDAACAACGYSHFNPRGEQKRGLKLPVIEREQITNPVVFRALTQARKVVNHVIARHGSPTYINIELARDIGKSAEDRDKIEQANEENKRAREEDNAHFREFFHKDPKGEDRAKWRLWHEQNQQCAYSQKPIELEHLLDPGSVEIDHILPYSRSLDNRMSNRVLVHCKENRDKGDRTPYEYMLGNPERWDCFKTWVEATYKRNRDKRANLLNESFAKRQEEWLQRSLNDTRYAASFFAGFVSHHLTFADPAVKQPVRCLAGGVTSLARGLWGLGRTREEKVRLADDLHHAVDATVIAMLTPGRIKFITDYSQAKESGRITEITDEETGEVYEVFRDRPFEFPPPWKGFRNELLARLCDDPAEEMGRLNLSTYEDMPELSRMIVSRMPQRKVTGSIHEETIRSLRGVDQKDKPISAIRKPLTSLSKKDLDDLCDPEHNEKLYAAIRERMAPFADDKRVKAGQKAFGDPTKPLYKPTNDGSPGPMVKSVKVCKTEDGIKVRKGIADNGDMVRVDVSRVRNKKDKWQYYIAAIYMSDVMAGRLPDITGEFLFSLYSYDLIRIGKQDEPYFGYYRKYNTNTQSLTICDPNNAQSLKESIGVRNVEVFEKYETGVLGDYHRVMKEVRRGLANGSDLQPGEAED